MDRRSPIRPHGRPRRVSAGSPSTSAQRSNGTCMATTRSPGNVSMSSPLNRNRRDCWSSPCFAAVPSTRKSPSSSCSVPGPSSSSRFCFPYSTRSAEVSRRSLRSAAPSYSRSPLASHAPPSLSSPSLHQPRGRRAAITRAFWPRSDSRRTSETRAKHPALRDRESQQARTAAVRVRANSYFLCQRFDDDHHRPGHNRPGYYYNLAATPVTPHAPHRGSFVRKPTWSYTRQHDNSPGLSSSSICMQE